MESVCNYVITTEQIEDNPECIINENHEQ